MSNNSPTDTLSLVKISSSIDKSIKMAFLIIGILSLLMFVSWSFAYPYESYFKFVPIGLGVLTFIISVIFYNKKYVPTN